MLLFFIGVKDDLVYINPWKKLGAEVGTAMIIALFTDIHFTSLHGFLGIQQLPGWALLHHHCLYNSIDNQCT